MERLRQDIYQLTNYAGVQEDETQRTMLRVFYGLSNLTILNEKHSPFALSLSKGIRSCFDRLSTNGECAIMPEI